MNNASNVTLAESNKNNENLLSSKFVLHEKKDNSAKVAKKCCILKFKKIFIVSKKYIKDF